MKFWVSREILLRRLIKDGLDGKNKLKSYVVNLVRSIVNMEKVMLEDIAEKYITDRKKLDDYNNKYLYYKTREVNNAKH